MILKMAAVAYVIWIEVRPEINVGKTKQKVMRFDCDLGDSFHWFALV